MELNELRIWTRIKAGDKHALTDLHEMYFHQMCLFAHKSCNDPEMVEELVSDCFIKIWESRKKIEIKKSLKNYIFLMLRNGIIDHHRKKQIYHASLDRDLDIADESYFEEQQHYVLLYKAIQKLPKQRRRILELAVFESMPYREIGELLNISKNTVRTQVYRSYCYLKETLDPKDFYFLLLPNKINH